VCDLLEEEVSDFMIYCIKSICICAPFYALWRCNVLANPYSEGSPVARRHQHISAGRLNGCTSAEHLAFRKPRQCCSYPCSSSRGGIRSAVYLQTCLLQSKEMAPVFIGIRPILRPGFASSRTKASRSGPPQWHERFRSASLKLTIRTIRVTTMPPNNSFPNVPHSKELQRNPVVRSGFKQPTRRITGLKWLMPDVHGMAMKAIPPHGLRHVRDE
jgi:hypothetical protein